MSTRSVDSTYPLPGLQRPSSSWTSASPYTEIVSPYNASQRASYPSQPPCSPTKESPGLPPIRDFDRMNNYESPFLPSTSSYPQAYGASSGSQGAQEPYLLAMDRPFYYDPAHRYGQCCPQTNKPNAPQMGYARYAPSPYDYRAGVSYQPPYGPVDYAPSPTSLHHPSSPSGAMDTDTRNRRRRGNLPRQITDILRAWFHEHLDHPYPTEEDKQAFMAKTGLTIAQISNWFINARRRQLPALRQARDRGGSNSTMDYDSEQLRRQQQQPDTTAR
ncbi:uncharacterized protein Z518_03999 [Rhinocladiella mackenziei CBS 650.93]|uniref:Rhinocladiella mackenziei CBS 650.93 unplaced genomic scaffold supercont1.3, whole genome shotgun sequence n=1 Tax=Rhinocladiella mackenziei CBS 650.93 TaxID=1442369 RepID=A0A0D2JA95_9EURO|nr:uncharacterized protein Z518_03999 [Rhinocladiella mackenziei CBS 650.93]KIX06025.1 hypothetical protein Z518_03999 [Rhinocladiella mackenziei CBS 650.93]